MISYMFACAGRMYVSTYTCAYISYIDAASTVCLSRIVFEQTPTRKRCDVTRSPLSVGRDNDFVKTRSGVEYILVTLASAMQPARQKLHRTSSGAPVCTLPNRTSPTGPSI